MELGAGQRPHKAQQVTPGPRCTRLALHPTAGTQGMTRCEPGSAITPPAGHVPALSLRHPGVLGG